MSAEPSLQTFKLFCCMYPGCGKEYGTKFNLKRHVVVYHRKEKEVECQVCGKSFRVLQNYIEHSYIHTNEKPYKCQLCGKKFRHKASYFAHSRKKLCECMQDDYSDLDL